MDDIFVAYKKTYDENHGILCAEMSYVMEPDAKQVEQMKAYLANKYGKQTVELSMVEDKKSDRWLCTACRRQRRRL